MAQLHRFLGLLVVLTLALVVLGGVVRTTGAGDACPDWPLCHGRLIPPARPLVLLEWSHRLLAAVVGSLVFAGWAWTLRLGRPAEPLRGLASAALGLVGVQALLGGATVLSGLRPWLVVLHLGTALLFLAALVVWWQRAAGFRPAALTGPQRAFRGAVLASLFSLYGLVLLGGHVGSSGAGLACPDWPLCRGEVFPPPGPGVLEHFAHRLWAVLVAGFLGWLVVRARRDRPDLRGLSHLAAGAYGVQILVGWLNLLSGLHPAVVSAHLGLAAFIWTVLVGLFVRSAARPLPAPQARSTPAPAWQATVLDYLALTKPRIVVLLLVTTACTMVVAARGRPSAWLVLATLAGGALAAGAANALNCVLDRDVDAVMHRTRQRRPVAAGRIPPWKAVAFAAALAASSFWLLRAGVNALAAWLALGGLVFYVLVYTAWLKRTTPQNIVIGGAAGAVPPLVGWAAVTGDVGWAAWLLFAVVFLWTPPHFWALSLNLKEDYARARIPMLPVVCGEAETHRQIFLYTVATVAATFLLVPAAGLGWLYAAGAGLLGVEFVRRAWWLWRGRGQTAWALYRYSLAYLALLFASMVADRFVVSG